METNPGRRVRFTLSQRLCPELVVEEYEMKKKKGPDMKEWLGGRSVSWKCTTTGCPYTCHTLEGHITSEVSLHNHPPSPDALVKKEARALMKLKVTRSSDNDKLIRQLLGSVMPEYRNSLGTLESLQQVARRIKRKKRQEGGLQEDDPFEVTTDGIDVIDSHDNRLKEEEAENAVNIKEDSIVDQDFYNLMESNMEVVSLEELPATQSHNILDSQKKLPTRQDDNTFQIVEVDPLLIPKIA